MTEREREREKERGEVIAFYTKCLIIEEIARVLNAPLGFGIALR